MNFNAVKQFMNLAKNYIVNYRLIICKRSLFGSVIIILSQHPELSSYCLFCYGK